MKLKFALASAITSIGFIAASPPAIAAFVSESFSGVLAGSMSGYGFPGDFAAGNPFTITVGYDNSATDINSDPNIGLYLLGSGSVLSATVTDSLNTAHSFASASSTTSALIFADYNGISRVDFSGATNSDYSGYGVHLYLSDDNKQVVQNDQLSGLNLGGSWSSSYFEIASPNGIGGGGIYGYANLTAPVPEPQTYTLLAIGLGVLTLVYRRKIGRTRLQSSPTLR